MGWYLYGVTSTVPPSQPPGGLRGLDDAEVRFHGDGDLVLIVSSMDRTLEELQGADPDDTVTAVRRHDEVLTQLAAAVPVLPVRFGTVLSDRSAADDLLADRGRQLRGALAVVAGADEWVVQVDATETADAPSETLGGPAPGHAFFARKRSQARARADARGRAGAAADDLEQRLRPLARASQMLALRDPETVARAAYLVDRDDQDRFLGMTTACEGATVTVQGPLPPYRFAQQGNP